MIFSFLNWILGVYLLVIMISAPIAFLMWLNGTDI